MPLRGSGCGSPMPSTPLRKSPTPPKAPSIMLPSSIAYLVLISSAARATFCLSRSSLALDAIASAAPRSARFATSRNLSSDISRRAWCAASRSPMAASGVSTCSMAAAMWLLTPASSTNLSTRSATVTCTLPSCTADVLVGIPSRLSDPFPSSAVIPPGALLTAASAAADAHSLSKPGVALDSDATSIPPPGALSPSLALARSLSSSALSCVTSSWCCLWSSATWGAALVDAPHPISCNGCVLLGLSQGAWRGSRPCRGLSSTTVLAAGYVLARGGRG
mmetsp:Transcript_8932/g.21952  ORF Transcript_8932/g.21952 Transcript_8932/m.21952 type:complete len:278 (-) Transcript_8932:146-979(-)